MRRPAAKLALKASLLVCALQPILQAQTTQNPDAVCATCHAEIARTYAQTTMARGSGVATEGLENLAPGGFRHAPSGIDYRVFLRESSAWLTYDRAATVSRPALHGEQKLLYFVGSNQHGRTFLYRDGTQWFEAPINYYSRKALWDMAPNFGGVTHLPAPLPVDANCLHCHATAVATPLREARNRFAAAPFAQGGIGCSSCHGDPSAHLAAAGHGPIVNPGKLSPARRDSACLVCHLEGDATVFRANTSPASFRPGDDLDRYAISFVKASAQSGGGRAVSQWEALLRSACKAGTSARGGEPAKPGAGDKLTCTTCHDPHSAPSPAERVAFYRAKCLTCHNIPTIAAEHFPAQQDCASCHMPTRPTADISHNQSVDHNIQRNPAQANLRFASLNETTELVPVGPASVTDRDLGLAYAQLAERGDRAAGEKAVALLTRAAAPPTDTAAHVQLAFLLQRSGDPARAREEYQTTLAADPYEPSALGNLAVLDAGSGHVPEAVALLTRLIAADPTQTAAGLNLAFIQCRLGDKAKARATLQTIAHYTPDDPTLQTFLSTGTYGAQHCDLP